MDGDRDAKLGLVGDGERVRLGPGRTIQLKHEHAASIPAGIVVVRKPHEELAVVMVVQRQRAGTTHERTKE